MGMGMGKRKDYKERLAKPNQELGNACPDAARELRACMSRDERETRNVLYVFLDRGLSKEKREKKKKKEEERKGDAYASILHSGLQARSWPACLSTARFLSPLFS